MYSKELLMIKKVYKVTEDLISDIIYFNYTKEVFIVLSIIIISSLLSPILILAIPLYLIFLKGKIFFSQRAEKIKFRKYKNYFYMLDGWEYEEEVASVLRMYGYKDVSVTQKTGDDGIDLIFYRDNKKYVAQCKNWRKQVPVEPVRALYAVKEDFDADVVVMIASNGVTTAGEEFIKRRRDTYLLWSLDEILKMSRSIKE